MNEVTNKITTETLFKITASKRLQEKVIAFDIDGSEQIEVIINPNITLEERVSAITEAIEIVVDEQGIYSPFLKCFAVNYALLRLYSNIELNDPETIFKLTYSTEIIKAIENAVPEFEVKAIKEEIEAGINFKLQSVLKSSKWDDIADGIYTIINKANNELESLKDVDAAQVMEVIEKLKGIKEDKIINAILDKNSNKE